MSQPFFDGAGAADAPPPGGRSTIDMKTVD
jgi:hypothetical protein